MAKLYCGVDLPQAMQGVTELVRCERTADAWLTEVQQQLRYGQLSNDNHAFLHGRPTSVPGSWLGGRITCGNAVCGKIASANASPEQILAQECRHCRTERCARQRVAAADDPRVAAAFADAVAIFPTNDIKYHANKLRALEWASARQRHLYIAVAQDTASSAVLNEKPHLADDKLQWLQNVTTKNVVACVVSCLCASACPCEPRIIWTEREAYSADARASCWVGLILKVTSPTA